MGQTALSAGVCDLMDSAPARGGLSYLLRFAGEGVQAQRG